MEEEVLESRGVSPIVSDSLDPNEALPECFDRLLEMVRRAE